MPCRGTARRHLALLATSTETSVDEQLTSWTVRSVAAAWRLALSASTTSAMYYIAYSTWTSLFSHRVVSKWNMLDNDSVMAKTVNGFKTKLERERAKKMGLFLD